jgi:hypothetical protein
MISTGKAFAGLGVTFGVCGLCAAGYAIGGPASYRSGSMNSTSQYSYVPRPGGSSKYGSERREVSALDLRAPVHSSAGSDAGLASSRIQWQSRATVSASDDDRLPELAAAKLPMATTKSRAESLVRRARHEGIPFVRLWQGRSAFVSLGLNPRGVPGVWLIQKMK